MKAISILSDKANGRPVDRVEDALVPENMPWEVAEQFARWLFGLIPVGEKSSIDSGNRHFTTIAREYVSAASNAAAAEVYRVAYRKVRMLALLHVEAAGFGKGGRNAHRSHLRELLRLCRKYVEDNRSVKKQMSTLYGVFGTR